MASLGSEVYQKLQEFNIPFDELIFGKPVFDKYVGNSVVDSQINPEIDLGWIVSNDTALAAGFVAARHFNQVGR
jgi:hypothetical protein